MTQLQYSAYAAKVLRISFGVMFLAHSVVLKLLTFGLPATAGYFHSIGLPSWLATATFAAEAVGGVMLILGVKSRWVALGLLPALVGAIVFAHARIGWVFTAPGGGWEYPLYLAMASIAQFLLGDGRFALLPSRPHPQA